MFYIENIFWTSPLIGSIRYSWVKRYTENNDIPIEDECSLICSMILSSNLTYDKEKHVEDLINVISTSNVRFTSGFIYNLCINFQSNTNNVWWDLLYTLHKKRRVVSNDNMSYIISLKKYFILVEQLSVIIEHEIGIKLICSVSLLDHLLKNRDKMYDSVNIKLLSLPQMNHTLRTQIKNLNLSFNSLIEEIDCIRYHRRQDKTFVENSIVSIKKTKKSRSYYYELFLALIYHHTGFYQFSPLYNDL